MRYAEPAPAKLNLALHVRGRLPDGRHALETIFAFCVDGDRIEVQPDTSLTFTIGGPFADKLRVDEDNLVLRAARALANAAGETRGAALHLDKRLPIASGIGGGSADAAATLRLLTRFWSLAPSHATAVNIYEPGATLVSEMVAVSEYDVAYKTESTYNSMRAIPLRSEAVAEKGTIAPAG